ncbi:MAG: DegT/DnrJ/EryC1/StrS family aminotransferase [Pirellulales bacterium]
MIPLCDLQQQYLTLKDEIDRAMLEVAASGHYILGENVKSLEQELAAYCGCKHAVGVANGTDALHLALRALDIGPGDEVITTPFTFIATTEAIGLVGATPVFVDIDPQTFNLDPQALEHAVTSRTKAILPVHLYGQPCDMDAILAVAQSHGLFVVEDCAQAIGATYRGRKVGTLGDVGCFSFFPSKNLGCFGDGGMVVTNDERLFERVEVLRRHGGAVKYHHRELGLNSRLDELQAAILRVKWKYLDAWNFARRAHALRYHRLLQSIVGVTRPAELTEQGASIPSETAPNGLLQAVYHQYTITVAQRDAVAEQLRAAGVACFPYYPVPLHLQEVHANLSYRPGSLPRAEFAARSCLSLPMFPELSGEQQQVVAEQLESAVADHHFATKAA